MSVLRWSKMPRLHLYPVALEVHSYRKNRKRGVYMGDACMPGMPFSSQGSSQGSSQANHVPSSA